MKCYLYFFSLWLCFFSLIFIRLCLSAIYCDEMWRHIMKKCNKKGKLLLHTCFSFVNTFFLFFISLIPCSLLVKYAHNLMWLMFFRKKKIIITKVRTWPPSEYLFSIQSVSEEAFLFYTCRSINIYFELFSFCVSCVNLFSYA